MAISKFPLAVPTWDEKELQAIQTVVDSGLFTMGKHVKQFEEDFAKFVGSRFSVMVNSGSSANLLAIAALFYLKHNPLKRGDEIIVPAVSWSTSYFPLQQYGLKIKFVDIDLDTLNYNLKDLAEAVGPKTRAILAVNLLGNSNDFQAINHIIACQPHHIFLIEDNCESMGATFQGKQTGTFGLVGTFSTFFSHHMATMEGGLIVTDDVEVYHILLSLRSHGWTRHLPKENLLVTKSDNEFEEAYRFILPGYNLRPVEMSGAIGVEQLKKLPGFIEQRRKNAELFLATMDRFKEFFGWQTEIGESSWFAFAITIKDDRIPRDLLVKYLTQYGIDCRPVVAGNFAKNEAVTKFFDYELHNDLPNANLIDRNGLYVGNHPFDMTEMFRALSEALNHTCCDVFI